MRLPTRTQAFKSGGLFQQPQECLPHSGARFLLALAITACGLAQEFDTAIFLHESHERKSYSILDQVEDRTERQAFETLFRKAKPLEKRELAEAFLSRYPNSWLLAQVYEIASKASMDLEDYPRAVRYAKASLRLLPENPLLLVPLANVQIQQSAFREAAWSAREALEYLNRFDRPASVSEKDWAVLSGQLRASSYYALGRAALTEGLAATGEKRRELLLQSESSLSKARGLNAEDSQIPYLLGLTELSLGKRDEAAAHFFQVYRSRGPLGDKAAEQLRGIHDAGASATNGGFENFLNALATRDLPGRGAGLAPGSESEAGEYAGSETCRICHPQQHSAWEQTGMSRMFRPLRPESVIGDFEKNNQYADEGGFVYARMVKQDNRYYFDIRQTDGPWKRYPVDYTIGSKWQQAYATRLSNGRIHVFPIQYNALRGRWVNFWRTIDPPGSERAEILGFHKFSAATAYQVHCTPCHTSQLRLRKPGSWEPENVIFEEGGINCEMCHGPSARHAAAMKSGKPYGKQAIDPPVDFRRINPQDFVAICSQCHMQSAVRRPGARGELNYSARGSFFPQYLRRPYAEFSRKAFYKDGRFRETTFIVESFVRSACYKKGGAHCGHCHDPHPDDAASNLRSLKFLDQPDRMCLQCHPALAANIESHTHHPPSSEASRCVSCHMPRIMNSVLFQARSHQIDDIPNVEMTMRFGSEESPNACLLCHSAKDTQWLKVQLAAR